MKERIFEQISLELRQATRTDTRTTIVCAVVTLVLFTISMIFAQGTTDTISGLLGGVRGTAINTAPIIIMCVSLMATITIVVFSVRTLLENKKQRAALNEGLMKLYKDSGVDKYYDVAIFKGYGTRYNLFAIIIIAVGAVGVIAPLVVFINNLIV
jgi:hypothetical protein